MRTSAIIIKKQMTNEADQLVTCYTKDFGKLTAVAKSVLKPSSMQSMHLDTLNVVDFELIIGKSLPIISAAQAQATWPALKSSLSASAIAFFLTEVLDRMVYDNQRDDTFWNYLATTLEQLNSQPHPNLLTFRNLQLQLLNILGYTPHVEECIACTARASTAWALAPSLGGIICGECFLAGQRGILLSPSDLALFSGHASINDSHSHSILDSLYEEIANRQLLSLPFVYQQLRQQIL